MVAHTGVPPEVITFLDRVVDSVPALETLLLLWDGRHRSWSAGELAARVYQSDSTTLQILRDLQRHGLVSSSGADEFRYVSTGQGNDTIMQSVAVSYRTQLIPITTYLHTRPPVSVREFARAFEFKKER